jgi:hypothetical protein
MLGDGAVKSNGKEYQKYIQPSASLRRTGIKNQIFKDTQAQEAARALE